jgi:Galactose oxidase, central domain
LQEFTKEFIIYGGIKGLDSSDTIFVVDLKNFSFNPILAAQQKEVNGKALPGPRDDFCMITFSGEQPRTKPVYLVGGFKNGTKMNDVYKLNQNGTTFTWELLEVSAGPKPDPRSSFAACLASDTTFYVFGGSGDNNAKFNDLWQFNEGAWSLLSSGSQSFDGTADTPLANDLPLQKSGHQVAMYGGRHILVFGGIHEVTYEMNDLKIFDVVTKTWKTIDEENKNASESGSPKNKQLIQQSESLKKN